VRSGLGDFSGGEQPWHAPVYESIRFDSIRGKRLRRTKTRLGLGSSARVRVGRCDVMAMPSTMTTSAAARGAAAAARPREAASLARWSRRSPRCSDTRCSLKRTTASAAAERRTRGCGISCTEASCDSSWARSRRCVAPSVMAAASPKASLGASRAPASLDVPQSASEADPDVQALPQCIGLPGPTRH